MRKTAAVKTLVLGLGNSILTDDGVGIHVVRAVGTRLQRDGVAFAEASIGGLRLLDAITGCDRVVIVDAIQGRGKPGDVHSLCPNDLGALHSGTTHDLSLSGALDLGRSLGMMVPDDESIIIIGVEVEDVLTFGTVCTPAVAASIPRAADAVLAALEAQEGSSSTC